MATLFQLQRSVTPVLTFHGTDPGTDEAFLLGPEGVTGWSDSPAARQEAIERATAHGEFDVAVYRGPRLVTLTGWCRAPNMAALVGMRNDFMGMLADGDLGVLTGDVHGEVTTANVRIYGEPRFVLRGSSGRAGWTLKLRAPDPRRYGELHEFPGASSVADVAHDGNFPARPVVEITGSAGGGYTVTGPGGRVTTVTEPLVSGIPHTINYATGGLYVDGDRVKGGVTVYQPWAVPPGESVSVSVSAGAVSVAVRDTYI